MTTTSRRLSAKSRTNKPSHTPGKTKGGTCVKSELKTFGMNANPYKLRGFRASQYISYCKLVDGFKGNENADRKARQAG